jgi:hypothetical protein
MRQLLFLFLIQLSVTASSQNRLVDLNVLKTFPSHKAVLQHFYMEYEYESHSGIDLKFARKPDGWYVLQYDYVNNAVLSEEQFWKPNKYLKIRSFRSKKPSSADSLDLNKKNLIRDSTNYARHPFFGYAYWAEDVIRHLEPQLSALDDTLLYGLGRAYSAMAVNLSSNQFNFKQTPEFEFKEGGNCISSEQKDEITQLNKKAIQYFRMADSLNPNLCVVVGTINTKYCNEYVDLFYKLWPLENAEAAANLLPFGLYTKNMLSSARNYLASCEPNAILFTNGDNDTYPLYYVQITEGFRKDVSVVNVSMQATAMHIDATTRGVSNSSPTYSIPFREYESNNYAYLTLSNETDTLPFYSITSSIYNGNKVNASCFELTNGGRTFYAKPKTPYILKNTLAIWDLINSNPNRPIHFSQAYHANSVGLLNYTRFNGFTYTLSETVEPDFSEIIQFLDRMQTAGYDDGSNYIYCTHTKQWQNSLALNGMRYELIQLLLAYKDEPKQRKERHQVFKLLVQLNEKCFVPLPNSITPEIIDILERVYVN